jgi:hypothetical protein
MNMIWSAKQTLKSYKQTFDSSHSDFTLLSYLGFLHGISIATSMTQTLWPYLPTTGIKSKFHVSQHNTFDNQHPKSFDKWKNIPLKFLANYIPVIFQEWFPQPTNDIQRKTKPTHNAYVNRYSLPPTTIPIVTQELAQNSSRILKNQRWECHHRPALSNP